MARILVVEKDTLVAAELTSRLEALGYEVVGRATRGDEAIHLALNHKPDLVLLDVEPGPELDGLRVGQRLKEMCGLPLLVTARTLDDQNLQQALALQPSGVLGLPARELDLRAAIELGLRRHVQDSISQRTSQTLMATLDSLGVGVVATNRDLRVTYLNPEAERLTGCSSEQALWRAGESVVRFAGDEASPVTTCPLGRCLETATRFRSAEARLLCGSDDRAVRVTYSTAPIRGPHGDVDGVVIVLGSREEEAADSHTGPVAQSERATGGMQSMALLANGVAHEFNNLLTGILGHTQLARRAVPNGGPVASSLEQVEKAARRAAEQCDRLLVFAGQQSTIREPMDLGEQLLDSKHLLEVAIAGRAELKLETQSDIRVFADRSGLQELILGLGASAGTVADGSGATVTMRAARSAPCEDAETAGDESAAALLEVLVDDVDAHAGWGEPNSACESASALVRTAVERCGGCLDVERSAAGLRLVVSLPIVEPSVVVAEALEAAPERLSGLALVVDDDEEVRTITAAAMRSFGFRTEQACNGLEALEISSRQELDVVVMDVVMPGMNGREALERLRRDNPSLPVVMVSALTGDKGLELGEQEPTRFLKKPFSLDRLRQTIGVVMAQSDRQLEGEGAPEQERRAS